MKKKILGMFVCLLLMTTVGLPSITGEIRQKKDMPQLNEHRPAPLDTDWWLMFGHDLNHSRYSTSLGPDTNKSLWNYTTGFPVTSSPAVADGKVYIGSTDDKVYCLYASNGTKVWSYTTGWYVWSSPAVTSGKVYIGSEDYKVYCLNATTGGFIWSHGTGSYVDSSPAVASGKVYIGSTDGTVYCLNASTGAKLWSYTTGSYVFSSPAVASGKVYIGSYDHKVYCLNASTGVKLWNFSTGGSVYSSPAVADGKVYVGSLNDCKVYCLNATTGGLIWSYTTGSTVDSSPAVASGKVYIGSSDFKVYCLDATTGGFIWSYTTGGQVMYSSPAVASGKVYIGSYDHEVYCLNASTGAKLWNYTTGAALTSSPAVADGKVYIGSNDFKVYCFGPHQNQPPFFGTPSPANGSTGQPTSLSWSIPINDTEGDLFSWSIQCSNGQSNNGAGASNGTKTLTLSGLACSTMYTVWMNATDPTGSGIYTRKWYTFTTQLPFPVLDFIDIKGGLLGLSVVLTNTGNGTADNISWAMNTTTMLFSPKLKNGTIGTLGPGENAKIQIWPVVGLGKALLTFMCTYNIMNLSYNVDFKVTGKCRDRAFFFLDSFPQRIQPTKEWTNIENYSYVNRSRGSGVEFHYGAICNMHNVRVILTSPLFSDQVEFLAACTFTNGSAFLNECWITKDLLMSGQARWELELFDGR